MPPDYLQGTSMAKRRKAPPTVLDDNQIAATQEQLAAGAAQLGLTLPAQALPQLINYLQMLLRWNHVYNLTAVRDAAGMTVQHLLDSLAAVPALQRHAAGQALRVLDVGSGGGLPGVVWAAVCPQHRVTCVDTVAKKTIFVRQVAAELGLANLQAIHARVEEMQTTPFPLITARAFASLADIVHLTAHALAPGGVWMALKGQHPQAEIDALPDSVEVFHVEQLSVPGLEAERCIVWMRLRSATA